MKPITEIDDPRYVKALAHPLRIRILAMLADRSASPVQLSSQLDATLGTVAYHVRTLHSLGLVELVDTRQRRGATEHYYRAREHPRFPDDAWSGLAPVAKQRMLSAMLQQIGQYVTGSAAAGGFDRSEAHMTRSGRCSSTSAARSSSPRRRASGCARPRDRATAAKRLDKCGRRRRRTARRPFDAGLVVMLFEGRPARRRTADGARTRRALRGVRRRRPRLSAREPAARRRDP